MFLNGRMSFPGSVVECVTGGCKYTDWSVTTHGYFAARVFLEGFTYKQRITKFLFACVSYRHLKHLRALINKNYEKSRIL
jgi:cAMP phosphodiesterase